MTWLDYSNYLTIVACIIATLAILPPKNRAFRRRGWEPGLLNLKVWPARIWFFFKGYYIVESAYREAKDTPYLLQTLADDVLVLPPKYLPELRMLPGGKLSASEALVTSVLGQYSGVDIILKDRQAYDLARVQLTKSLPTIIPLLSEKVNEILLDYSATHTTSDYVSIQIQDLISDIVLRTTLLAFVGPRLAEDSELHKVVKAHPNLVRDIAVFMLFVPSFMRSFIRPFLPPAICMKRLHARMRKILFPDTGIAEGKNNPTTLLQHFVDTSDPVIEEDIVAKLLVVIGAALHTMTMSTVHAVIDLCAYPVIVKELRDEISQHLPTSESAWQAEQVSRLKVLDSFLKESQRFNSPNYLSFDRMTMTSVTLHDGVTIPKGTYICMAAGSMAMDPEFYDDPKTFLPARFQSGSSGTADGRKNLDFVGTESGNIHWGSGRFTCPGRWYASAMMKVIVAQIVKKYDVKFPSRQTERLPNVYMDIMVEPNPKQAVLMKLR